jgi:superfamily I DNA/RNA helicase
VDFVFPAEVDELALLRTTAEGALEEANGLDDFLATIRYGVSQREVPLEAVEARVMSLHASKGLTADLVVLAGLVEGLMPYVDPSASVAEQEAQLQEQRRLFYVGMTRTRNALVFSTYSQLDTATAMSFRAARGRRVKGGFRVLASSFLGELGDELPPAVRGAEWRY